ncbi:MAG: hypothetical protein ACRDPW_10295 [Mycobacteriales bacterium]
MTTLSSMSIRIPRQTRYCAARVAEQTGESVTAVIARAVKQAEDELFYKRLVQAASRDNDDYLHENEPWMQSELSGASEPEEKFGDDPVTGDLWLVRFDPQVGSEQLRATSVERFGRRL